MNEPEARELEPEEVIAIVLYTGDGVYTDLNSALRSGKHKKWDTLIFTLNNGLLKLPSFIGTAFRGFQNTITVEKGGELVFKTCTSMTTDYDVALAFTGETLFGITCHKHGHDVGWASKYQDEKEILFPPYVQFNVTRCESHDGTLEVHLEESLELGYASLYV